MVSEILIRRECKRIMRYGIPKAVSFGIVLDVASTMNNSVSKTYISGESFKRAVNYALNLTYNMSLNINN